MNEKLTELFRNYTSYDSQSEAISATIKMVHLMSDKENLKWVIQQLYSKSKTSNPPKNDLLVHYVDMFNDAVSLYNVLEELGDDQYTLSVMMTLSFKHVFTDELKEILISKHLSNMVKNNQFIPQVMKSQFMNNERIEWVLNVLDNHKYNSWSKLSSLLSNHHISPHNIDRLSFYLKANNHVHLDAPMWLDLLLNPNITYTIIKNHLSRESLKELLKSQSHKCLHILIQRNKNKPEIDKLALLEAFPFLTEYGLEASPLDSSIEILGGLC